MQKNEETVKKYLKEAKNVPGAAAKNYNANVKQFLEVTKAHSKETAKQYVYKAKGDAYRAIKKYKADVKQFLNVTKTNEKFAEECLRDAKCDAERAIENYFNHVTEERVKEFRDVTQTNRETATVYLYKAKGDTERAIENYLNQIENFFERTGRYNEKVAKFYLNKANGADEYKNLSVSQCTEIAINIFYQCDPNLIKKFKRRR